MDIAISKKKTPNLKRFAWIAVASVAGLFVVQQLVHLARADFSVKEDSMVIAEVNRGKFTVAVRGTGLLVPDNIQWLSANVEAKVEKLLVKAGSFVRTGDLIAILSNPQLVQQLEEIQWELEAQQAETTASRIAQESSLLEQKSNMLNAKLNYESSLLKSNAQAQLYKQSTGAVSKLDYERTLLETSQFKQRWAIGEERYKKMQENLVAQNNARLARLNKTKKTLERIEQQVEGLRVLATMDSVVQDIALEPGQQILVGSNIAKLAQQDSLIAELQIPEIQIRQVKVGQKVIVDTRNNKIEGLISRIDPAVINGNVQVDVNFTQPLPSDARSDLSVDGEIKIAEMQDTLHVDRPLFAQSQSRSALYRLTDDGQFAERISVTLGYGSVNQIEIIEGLAVGDKIIISDPTSWETYSKIRIN